MLGVPVNVPPVPVNIFFSAEVAVEPVPEAGILYALLYAPELLVESLIRGHP